MPAYRYVAKKGPQELIEGILEADTRANVLTQLVNRGYTPVEVTEASGSSDSAAVSRVKVPVRELNHVTRQLASLVRSQVPILRALRVIGDQTSHPKIRAVIRKIEEDVRQGNTVAQAMGRYPRVFPPLYTSLVHSGEIGGMLEEVLDRLVQQADREEALMGKVRSALIYPFFVAGVGILTVLFLLSFVMPRIVRLFDNFEGVLPLPTRILLTLSDWVCNPSFWGILGGAVFCFFVGLRILGERGYLVRDRLILKLPLIGPMIKQVELARFARSFGLLLDHGIPILHATEIAVPVVGHRVIRMQLSRLSGGLKDGQLLSACLKGMPVATPFLVNTVAVGEESGKVGEALMEVAGFYEKEADRTLGTLATLLEPTVILLVGAIVGFIVMAVLLPIFELSSIVR